MWFKPQIRCDTIPKKFIGWIGPDRVARAPLFKTILFNSLFKFFLLRIQVCSLRFILPTHKYPPIKWNLLAGIFAICTIHRKFGLIFERKLPKTDMPNWIFTSDLKQSRYLWAYPNYKVSHSNTLSELDWVKWMRKPRAPRWASPARRRHPSFYIIDTFFSFIERNIRKYDTLV